jgi:S1-C subfamily serine protease
MYQLFIKITKLTIASLLFIYSPIIATEDISKIIEEINPAVVNIYVSDKGLKTSAGTGFFINPNGYIITNKHIIEKAKTIKIKIYKQKEEFNAKIIDLDKNYDIALLKIDIYNIPIVKIGNSDSIKTGEEVIAIGNPFGLQNTVSKGIISSDKREDKGLTFIQTNIDLNPGNSGGPLINLKGEVIGINTSIIKDSKGIGFAVPINAIANLIEKNKIGVNIVLSNKKLSFKKIEKPKVTEKLKKLNILYIIIPILLILIVALSTIFVVFLKKKKQDVTISLKPSAKIIDEDIDKLDIELK